MSDLSGDRRIRFYLDDDLRRSAEAGTHNFLSLLAGVLRAAGYEVSHHATGPAARLQAPLLDGWAIYHMEAPTHARALTLRRAYHYPFWAIEPVAERWQWHVARSRFDPAEVPRREADGFHRRWAQRLFGTAPAEARRGEAVYVPLQGRLLERRSFQSCSPLDMVRRVLEACPDRPVEIGLHPKERYSPQERVALDAVIAGQARVQLRTGGMEAALARCDHVVTMNSSAAFDGFFFRKPCILFGSIDFHHIALQATPQSLGAFAGIADHAPDYAGYLWWYWQRMSINAGHESAGARIRAALERCGLPL